MSKCIRGIPWYNDKVKAPYTGEMERELDKASNNGFSKGLLLLTPQLETAVKKINSQFGLPQLKGYGIVDKGTKMRHEGVYATYHKGKLSLDVSNINKYFDKKEERKMTARAEVVADRVNRMLGGEKMITPLYNIYANLYSTKESQILAHTYHEMGHHLVESKKLKSLIEKAYKEIKKRNKTAVNSIYSRKNADEWFSENFSYWAMNNYHNEAPIGQPRRVLDPEFLILLRSLLDRNL